LNKEVIRLDTSLKKLGQDFLLFDPQVQVSKSFTYEVPVDLHFPEMSESQKLINSSRNSHHNTSQSQYLNFNHFIVGANLPVPRFDPSIDLAIKFLED